MFDRFVPMNTQATSRYIGSPYEAELKTLAQLKQQADETTALQQDTELGYMYANVDPHDKDAWEQGVIAPTKAKLASATATPEFGVQAAKYTAKEFAAKQNLFKNEQAKRQQTSKQIDDMVEKKVISSKRADETRMLNRHFDKGMQYDPTTGKFSSTYNPILPVEEYDMTKAVKDIVPLLHQRGMLQAKNPDGTTRTLSEQEVVEIGNRWITNKSVKSFGVDEVALGKAFSALIANDPKFQADIQFQKQLGTYKITPEAVAAAKFNPQVEAQLQAAEQKGIPRHIALRSMVENQIDTGANNRLAMLAQSFAWQDSSEKTDVKENAGWGRQQAYGFDKALQEDRQSHDVMMEDKRTANDIMINAYKEGNSPDKPNGGYEVAKIGGVVQEEADYSFDNLTDKRNKAKTSYENTAREIQAGKVGGVTMPWKREDVVLKNNKLVFRGRKTDENLDDYNNLKEQFDAKVRTSLDPIQKEYYDNKNRLEKYYFKEGDLTAVEKAKIEKKTDEILANTKAGEQYGRITPSGFTVSMTRDEARRLAIKDVMKGHIEKGDSRAKFAAQRNARLGLTLLPDEKMNKHQQSYVEAALGTNVGTSGIGLRNRDGSNFDEDKLKEANGGAEFRRLEYNPNTGQVERVVEIYQMKGAKGSAKTSLGTAYMSLNAGDKKTLESNFGTYGVQALEMAGQAANSSNFSTKTRMPNGKIVEVRIEENSPGTGADYKVVVDGRQETVANDQTSVVEVTKRLLEEAAKANSQ